MLKLHHILPYFIFLLLISVALAEPNLKNTTDEILKEEGDIFLRGTLLSLMLIVVSLILGHYMDDHDEYNKRLIDFQHYYIHDKSNTENCELNNYIKKKNVEDCFKFRNTIMHFGVISFTLILCFLIATAIATCLFIEFLPFCDISLNFNLIILIIIFTVDFLLLFQFWMYLGQGNSTAQWIRNLEYIGFEEKYCSKYYNFTTPRHLIGEYLTKSRQFFARVSDKKNYKIYPNLFTNIGFIIWVILLFLLAWKVC